MLDKNLEIIAYQEQYKNDFTSLNFEWLEEYFYIEDYDREVLTNPEKYILEKEGFIFFAKYDYQIVGTVALIKRDNAVFELSKMAVTPKYKGLKIGLQLMNYCIAFAKKNQFERLFLDSSRKLTPAINLYKKVGFVEIPVPKDTPYERCNIRMELKSI